MVSEEVADLFLFISRTFFIHFTPAHPRHQIHADAERVEKAQPCHHGGAGALNMPVLTLTLQESRGHL